MLKMFKNIMKQLIIIDVDLEEHRYKIFGKELFVIV